MSTLLTLMRASNPAPTIMITLMASEEILHHSSEALSQLMASRLSSKYNLGAGVESVFVPLLATTCLPA